MATVTKTYSELIDKPVIVYNFEVAEFHTYYVTDTGVLVHNSSKDKCSINTNQPKSSNEKDKLNYEIKPLDTDYRGTGITYRQALEEAFAKTGHAKEEFHVTKWARDLNGKSIPVEYETLNHTQVSMDIAHYSFDKNGVWNTGPDAPHIGWVIMDKKPKVVGHILIDHVPTGRDYAWSW